MATFTTTYSSTALVLPPLPPTAHVRQLPRHLRHHPPETTTDNLPFVSLSTPFIPALTCHPYLHPRMGDPRQLASDFGSLSFMHPAFVWAGPVFSFPLVHSFLVLTWQPHLRAGSRGGSPKRRGKHHPSSRMQACCPLALATPQPCTLPAVEAAHKPERRGHHP
eukprot:1140758-Pelagomonas_calceolata.AAC.9